MTNVNNNNGTLPSINSKGSVIAMPQTRYSSNTPIPDNTSALPMNAITDNQPSVEQTPESVLRFWFKDEASGRMDLPQSKRWFSGGKKLDLELQTRFGDLLELARSGQLDHWLQSADSTLALIVLLDQFNRNIHRGTADAFAADDQALAACQHAISMRYVESFSLTQKVFCYLPLEHDESPESQLRSVALFEALTREQGTPELHKFATSTLSSAHEHKRIVDQFGRYPYRNKALGRTSTSEELDWMAQSNKRFGQ
ncbi:DUF924 family protein [Granulosicoccus antarcticus]|nr:DUF924 family protein [Granulosicoccus antarcticus]